jgi:3-oxoacyl-[acyl-carrier protein] reductase
VLPCDLGERAQAAALIGQAEAALGGVDILVNNAGLTRDNLALRIKDEDWERVLEVNLGAAFRLSRAALRGMMRQRWGRIVNIASIVGVTGNPGQANYAASKAGLVGLARSLAREFGSRAITSNVVAPGPNDTGMFDEVDDARREAIVAAVPLARTGTPDEVAATISFLCSEDAGYITGVVLPVDGGLGMGT